MNDPKHNTLPTLINPLHHQLVRDQQHMIETCPVPLLEQGQLHIYFHVPEMTETTRPLLHTVIIDRKSTRLNSSHSDLSRMPSSA